MKGDSFWMPQPLHSLVCSQCLNTTACSPACSIWIPWYSCPPAVFEHHPTLVHCSVWTLPHPQYWNTMPPLPTYSIWTPSGHCPPVVSEHYTMPVVSEHWLAFVHLWCLNTTAWSPTCSVRTPCHTYSIWTPPHNHLPTVLEHHAMLTVSEVLNTTAHLHANGAWAPFYPHCLQCLNTTMHLLTHHVSTPSLMNPQCLCLASGIIYTYLLWDNKYL